MGRYLLADRACLAIDHVDYLIRPGDPDSDPWHQEVRIPIDGLGECDPKRDLLTTAGTRVNRSSEIMVGKLVRLRRERGEWPQRAAFQSG